MLRTPAKAPPAEFSRQLIGIIHLPLVRPMTGFPTCAASEF